MHNLHSGRHPPQQQVHIWCRPVTSDMVDDQMPLIGIPSFIKPAGPSATACSHYFVSVRPSDSQLSMGAPEAAGNGGAKGDSAVDATTHVLPVTTTLTKRTPSVSSIRDVCSVGWTVNMSAR